MSTLVSNLNGQGMILVFFAHRLKVQKVLSAALDAVVAVNQEFAPAFQAMAHAEKQGTSVQAALRESGMFMQFVSRLFALGERYDLPDQMLVASNVLYTLHRRTKEGWSIEDFANVQAIETVIDFYILAYLVCRKGWSTANALDELAFRSVANGGWFSDLGARVKNGTLLSEALKDKERQKPASITHELFDALCSFVETGEANGKVEVGLMKFANVASRKVLGMEVFLQ